MVSNAGIPPTRNAPVTNTSSLFLPRDRQYHSTALGITARPAASKPGEAYCGSGGGVVGASGLGGAMPRATPKMRRHH